MSLTLPPELREYGFAPGKIVRIFFHEGHKAVVIRLVEDQVPPLPEELVLGEEDGA